MNMVEELIEKFCPEGVEYKTLGEIGNIERGGNFQKKDFVDQGFGCIHYGQIYTYYGTFTDNVIQSITPEIAKKQPKAKPGDIIITLTSENIEDVCKAVAWIGKDEIAISGHAAILRHHQNPKYLAYYLQTEFFFEQKKKYARGAKVIEMQSDKLLSILIPVPPLPVQEEIVRILDCFSSLTAELQEKLQAELQARKSQYEYYRDKLLSFDRDDSDASSLQSDVTSSSLQKDCNQEQQNAHGNFSVTSSICMPWKVKWMRLGDVGTFKYGFTDIARISGTARFIRITDIDENGYLNQHNQKYLDINNSNEDYILKKGDLIVARTGATYGKTLYYTDEEPAIYASFLIKIILNNNLISNKYYWHFTKSSLYWKQANYYVSKGGQPQFNTNALCHIEIPIPPLSEQERIVAILDRFDALINDIATGLPAEIAARQQQYEYYRDKLLTFKRVES